MNIIGKGIVSGDTKKTKVVAKKSKKEKRAKGPKGKFLADDPATPEVNEAWESGESPSDQEE